MDSTKKNIINAICIGEEEILGLLIDNTKDIDNKTNKTDSVMSETKYVLDNYYEKKVLK